MLDKVNIVLRAVNMLLILGALLFFLFLYGRVPGTPGAAKAQEDAAFYEGAHKRLDEIEERMYKTFERQQKVQQELERMIERRAAR